MQESWLLSAQFSYRPKNNMKTLACPFAKCRPRWPLISKIRLTGILDYQSISVCSYLSIYLSNSVGSCQFILHIHFSHCLSLFLTSHSIFSVHIYSLVYTSLYPRYLSIYLSIYLLKKLLIIAEITISFCVSLYLSPSEFISFFSLSLSFILFN